LTWFRGQRSEDDAGVVVVGGTEDWGLSAVEDGLVTCDYAEARTEGGNNAEIAKIFFLRRRCEGSAHRAIPASLIPVCPLSWFQVCVTIHARLNSFP
jgi:hypothetical protein